MKSLKMFDRSRYNNVPKLYEEDFGFMVLPFCPEFEVLHSYVVKPHDTISKLALDYYGDTTYQWAIISANDLPFPPKLVAGTIIYLPAPEEVRKYTLGV